MEQRAGQPLQHAADACAWAAARRRSASMLDKVIPPMTDPPRHEIRQARADPERAAVEVLGPRHVPRRARPAARGLRRAPRRALSAGHLSTATSRSDLGGLRETPPDPNLQARVQRALPPRPLQPDPAGGRLPVLQGMDRPGLPAHARHRDPARQPVLRRFLRGELGQPRPVRRRDHERADARTSRRSTAASARAGRGSCTAARRAAGRRWRRRCSIPTSTTAPGPPAPTRSTSAPTPWSTSTRTRTPTGPRARSARCRARDMRNYLGHVSTTLEEMNRLELVLGTKTRERPAVGHLGGGVLAAGAGRLPEADLGQAHRRDRPRGRRVLEGALRPAPDPAPRLEPGLGKKLEGKIHLYVGDMDNYYLNNAVYLVEDFLEEHEGPVLRRRGDVRRPRRALLERRSHPPQRVLPPSLPPDVHPEVRRARPADRAAGSGPDVLAVLTSGSARDQADSPSTAGFSRPDWRPRRSSTAGCWRRSRSSCLRRPYTCRCER